MSNEKKSRASIKRHKDELSVTLIGMIVYAIILIVIVAGTYLGIKVLFANQQKSLEKDTMEVSSQTKESETVTDSVEPGESKVQETEEDTTEETITEAAVDSVKLVTEDKHYIDYNTTYFEPAKRNASLTWNDKVFSRLENVENPSEAPINSYLFSRKFALREDDKKMEFDIFTNPENKKIEKITAIEYCGEDIEIIDYYYDNGKINYIDQYRSIINTPIDIASAEVLSRYYFNKDVMVKYSYCTDNTVTEYTVADLDRYSSGTVGQYEYLEKTMLNWAYLTYYAIGNIEETEKIEGYVLDEFNTALADVEIQLYADSNKTVMATTTTNGDGYYSLEIPVNDLETYTINAKKNTLDEVNVYGITAGSGSSVYDVEPVYLAYTEVGAIYNVQIMARDAENVNTALADATIKLRNGINNQDGEVIATGTLDTTGAITAPMRAGSYTAQISKGGYEDSYFTVIVRMDHQAELGYAVPDLHENEFKTVFSWDTTPLDLDARVFSSGAAKIIRAQSDSVGSTMTEVIDIANAGSDTYQYFVSDYSNCTGGDALSYNMTTSNANVAIYNANGLIASYHVPMAHCGVVWKPFEIRNQKILPINDYYNIIEPDTYWTTK